MTTGMLNLLLPPLKQSICAVYICGGSDGDHFEPVGSSVHDSEQMGTRDIKKGAYQVPSPHDVAEPPLGHFYCVVAVLVHCDEFSPAGSAGPCNDFVGESFPDIPRARGNRRCIYLGVGGRKPVGGGPWVPGVGRSLWKRQPGGPDRRLSA